MQPEGKRYSTAARVGTIRHSALAIAPQALQPPLDRCSHTSLQPPHLCAQLLQQVNKCNDLATASPLCCRRRPEGRQLRLELAKAVAKPARHLHGRRRAARRGARSGRRAGTSRRDVHRTREDGVDGLRDELLPVVAYSAAPAFRVERAAYPLLGAGTASTSTATLSTTSPRVVAREHQSDVPGMLDHVAAGQLADVGGRPGEQVLAELAEEAGVPAELGKRAAPASVVSYRGVAGEGKGERVTNEVLFCYDIELPSSFVPRPVDGEVEGFELRTVDAVLADLVEGRLPNVAVVTVHFQRGASEAGDDGYPALVSGPAVGALLVICNPCC